MKHPDGFMRAALCCLFLLYMAAVAQGDSGAAIAPGSAIPAWGWALMLFVFSLGMGVVAIMAGVGGGVLFVPFVGSFFPFHMDFIRGASLFVALAGALNASGNLMRQGFTFPRLVLPLSLASSAAAILGAMAGLSLPENILRILLGLVIVAICAVMIITKRSDFPMTAGAQDPLSAILDIGGSYHDHSKNGLVVWKARRMPLAILLFTGIGFLAGMFGLGAGWANVPVLNLVVGAPLKAAVSSSLLVISISDTAPAFIYLNSGAVLPLVTVPAVLGMMLGSAVGMRLISRVRPDVIRIVVISLLGLAGVMSLLKGFGIL